MTKPFFIMAFRPRPAAPIIQWVRAYVTSHPGDDRLNAIAAMESEYPSGEWLGFKDVDARMAALPPEQTALDNEA